MKKNFLVLFFLLLLCAGQLFSQQRDGIELTMGFELRRLQNFGVFNLDSVALSDPDLNFRGVYQFHSGFGFGGIIRMKLSDTWNLESGLYYTRRNFRFKINDLMGSFEDEIDVRNVSYEIPLKGLVYIRLGERVFMNVALGASVNFVASDIASYQLNYSFKAFKPAWARAGIIGNLGVEYRTPEDGYFYIGASYNQILGDMMITEIDYFRGGDPPAYRQRGTLDGTYFAIDFRYFFPIRESSKPEIKRQMPDWKNM